MKVAQVKTNPYSGSDYSELYPQARKLYNQIKGQTKRQPYVRSKYFDGQKVFIELFWIHLNQKTPKERRKRIKFYSCGIELLRETRQQPTTKKSLTKKGELLHRFAGVTPLGDLFYIQVKENTKTKRRDLMSIFSTK
ncbi:hypothetical protein KBB49_01880 [Candidatus Saccharibacteria bacterium]|nr:hypothetical protein [Candidatus Saccharibacteria bacterium]